MKKKLESELISLAHEILKMNGKKDIDAMHLVSKRLYEKLTILNFVENHFGELKPKIGKEDVENKLEELSNSFLDDNKPILESNSPKEAIITPEIETTEDIVKEIPKDESLEEILSDVLPNPTFVKRDAELVSPTEEDIKQMEAQKERSLNDQFRGTINIGLNDRIGFIKHLFDGNNEDYNRVLSQLNSLGSESEIKNFIEQMIKPDHNNWEGKEEYEHRFLGLIGIRNN